MLVSSQASSGIIFDISRFCLDDGPGIRTVVFFKGCPLHCAWCHNPEGLSGQVELSCQQDLCVSCANCIPVCPAGCHRLDDKGVHRFDFTDCIRCGRCLASCPNDALAFIGRHVELAGLLDELLADQVYYHSSGGGVTLSGGEVLAQAHFAAALLTALQEHGVHSCLESSGAGSSQARSLLFPLADLVLLDYKHSDPTALYKWTGLAMAQFQASLELLEKMDKPTILRCPLIEEVNADDSHIRAIADIAAGYACIHQIDLLPYHELGFSKARNLGLSSRKFRGPTKSKLAEYRYFLQKKTGKPVNL